MTAKSQFAYATTEVYVTDSDIVKLATALSSFPSERESEISWQIIGTTEAPKNFSLKVFQKDKCGHLLIEVYMVINDGDCGEKHHCCFFIQTEIGRLNTFGKRLLSLNKPVLGTKIALADDDICP